MFAYLSHIAVGQSVYKVHQAELPHQAANPFHVRLRITECNVFSDGSGKQFDLLGDSAYPAPEAAIINLGNVIVSNADTSGLNGVDVLQKGNQCCFARTAFSDDGGSLAFFYGQIQGVEYFLARTISEGDILKGDVAHHIRFQNDLLFIVLLSFQIHNLKQAVGGYQCVLNSLVG